MKMKFFTKIFLCLLFTFTSDLFPVSSLTATSALESRLGADIGDGRLDDFSGMEAAFILSGIREQDELNAAMAWYRNLVETIRAFHFDPFDRTGSANKVFSYLHGTWLKQYEKETISLLDIVHKKKFNCVTATILYNMICEDFGWRTEAFETPTHVYTIFTNFTNPVMVENTTPMGFDIVKNLRAYSNYLAQFYPQSEVLEIGLDKIYLHENSRGREISNTELLGLLVYNRAFFAEKNRDYGPAYRFVRLAQQFNPDSRSNEKFEIGLYFKWGKQSVDQGNNYDAFQVYDEACGRHPNIPEFCHNKRTAFFKSAVQSWTNKDWSMAYPLFDRMMDSEFSSGDEYAQIKGYLKNWAVYFVQQHKKKEIGEAAALLEYLDPQDPFLIDLKNRLKSSPEE
jgi:hypothetical protein